MSISCIIDSSAIDDNKLNLVLGYSIFDTSATYLLEVSKWDTYVHTYVSPRRKWEKGKQWKSKHRAPAIEPGAAGIKGKRNKVFQKSGTWSNRRNNIWLTNNFNWRTTCTCSCARARKREETRMVNRSEARRNGKEDRKQICLLRSGWYKTENGSSE